MPGLSEILAQADAGDHERLRALPEKIEPTESAVCLARRDNELNAIRVRLHHRRPIHHASPQAMTSADPIHTLLEA